MLSSPISVPPSQNFHLYHGNIDIGGQTLTLDEFIPPHSEQIIQSVIRIKAQYLLATIKQGPIEQLGSAINHCDNVKFPMGYD